MNTKLNEIFAKDVHRPIEGVIKADDQTQLQTEVEEYVITNEVEMRLEEFLDAYLDYQGANGVWVSGFFGSGKSHLLKMLSYLLESGTNGNDFILKSFIDKAENAENVVLRAKLEKVARIPSKSILFNIDQKADTTDKAEFDALLGVFVKVFDEMQGYFGKEAEVAKFERDLDSRGVYDAFQQSFEEESGIPWVTGREQAILEADNIAKAYAKVLNKPEEAGLDIIDKYRDAYSLSIEDFANMVNDYIQQQEDGFRLNFYVDEVGQYIADNVKLMTNLQTIAESLATKCHGQAWIIVTAQEDMKSVVGELTQQSNDFSKIQARFNNRVKLTSANVDEVIKKRLLAKNSVGEDNLKDIYQQQSNNFKTLFDFADGAKSYRNFRTQVDFIDSYPFIPYQFDLFQEAIQSLSDHNAFEGRHSSVGERSMLGVFQQVLKQNIGDDLVGRLATFDFMYDGISNSLKTGIRNSIIIAEKNLDSEFALRVLKALFLVKYVNSFNATPRNISVLMTERFDDDIVALRERVQESLDLLESQTYIERNGESYAFLTDAEKDIETEIKNTEIDRSKVFDVIGDIIFSQVISDTKIQAANGSHSYSYTRMIDDTVFRSQTNEIKIHVITPFHENASNETVLIAQSMGSNELRVVLPANKRLADDIRLYLKTEKYYKQNVSSVQSEQMRILSNKQHQNNERKEQIRKQLESDLTNANYIAEGTVLDASGSDAKSLIIKAFQKLILRVYSNLKMLDGRQYDQKQISGYINKDDGLFAGDTATMTEPEQAIESFIILQQNQGQRVTVHELITRFEKKPYGWYFDAIVCILAKLYARGRVEVKRDGKPLEGNDLAEALLNTRQHGNLLLGMEKDFTTSQIRNLREFYTEFFNVPISGDDGKSLGMETKEKLRETLADLQGLLDQRDRYPFMQDLDDIVAEIKHIIGKPYDWFLTDFESREELLIAREDTISPIRSFMNGGQRDVYDTAHNFLRDNQNNFAYVGFDEADELRKMLNDPRCYRGDNMRFVKERMDELAIMLETALEQAKNDAVDKVRALQSKLEATDNYKKLKSNHQDAVSDEFSGRVDVISEQITIPMVNEAANTFERSNYNIIVRQIAKWLEPDDIGKTGDDEAPEPEYISRNTIQPTFTKAWLEDDSDVDAYMDELKKAYLQAIREGKRIQI